MNLDYIPRDLIPLSRVASRLRVSSRKLRDECLAGRFPTIYEPTPGILRVSSAAVEEWFRARDVERVEQESERYRRSVSADLRGEPVGYRTP